MHLKKILSLFPFILILSFISVDKTFSKENVVIEKILFRDANTESDKFVKILAIDGGGIRGIIPAIILKEIESRLKNKKNLSECFDVMAGSSTGAIIVLLLNVPDEKNKPKFQMSDIVDLYLKFGSEIFYQSLWQRIVTMNGWLGAKYSEDNLVKSLQKYFNDTQLKDSLTEVLIPTYDISRDQTIFFKSSYAKEDNARNFYFKDIAYAATAAPTYFKPATIKDLGGKNQYVLIDGGIAVNNPSLSASIHALKTFSKQKNFLIVSIGCGTNNDSTLGIFSPGSKKIKNSGKIMWAENIVSIILDAGNDVVDYLIQNAFVPDKIKMYFRFQEVIDPKHDTIDNVSKDNIAALEQYARDLIKKHDAEINHIAQILDD